MSAYSPQIVKTLADQVKTLTPLRQSFSKLQNYYHQLTRDVSELIAHTDNSQKQLFSNLKYLEEIHRSLQRQFSCCGEQLKQLEYEKAKVQMQGSQQTVQAESLKKRQLLQLQQKSTLENKRKEIMDQNEKITFGINKFKEMIHNIELAIKSKEYQNIDVQRQIKKMELVNQKINQLNQTAQINITNMHKDSQTAVEQIYELQCKLQTYGKLIDAKQKQNKQSVEILITKTEELQQLRHKKHYIQKLLQAQLGQQRQMTKIYGQLQSILAVKNDKLMFVKQENQQYQKMIAQEKGKQNVNKDQLLRLKTYLQTLISTNEHLYSQLQKSCSQDREVQVMLSDKLQKLLVINDKITENDILNSKHVHQAPVIFKERNLSPKSSPQKPQSLHTKLISQLSSSPKGEDRVLEKNYIHRQMSTTWGSSSKENRL